MAIFCRWNTLTKCSLNFIRKYHPYNDLSALKSLGYFENILPQKSEHHLHSLEVTGPLHIYCGFDPTSESLQLGNLVSVIGLLRTQASGNDAICLIGQGTSLIGDPSGRKNDRAQMELSVVAQNSVSFAEQLSNIQNNFASQFLPNLKYQNDAGKFRILNNYEWLRNETLLDFLTESAGFVRLQELIHKDSVRLRESAGTGMNMKEFVYPLLQAFDFLYLYQKYNCNVQLGGNDQIGNIDVGISLIRRKLRRCVFGLTVPLLVSADGTKVGKTTSVSQDDVIWLSKRKLRPFSLFQRLLNLQDAQMCARLFQQLTFFSMDEISQLLSEHTRNPARRIAQRTLAREVTLLVHGADSLQACELACRILFSSSSIHPTSQTPLQVLANDLSPTERNFLSASLFHPAAPVSSPLPVVHDDSASQFPLLRLRAVLKKVFSSNVDRASCLTMEHGVTLNGIQLLKPVTRGAKNNQNYVSFSADAKTTSCHESLDSLINQFSFPESVINDAFNGCDPSTGISVLHIGKKLSWFVVPSVQVKNF